MTMRSRIAPGVLRQALETARALAQGHCDPAVPTTQRLREIAKKLGVTRIEAGALDTDGYLAEEADGTFAIYYSTKVSEPGGFRSVMPARHRFTIAHELAHIILDKHYKHLGLSQRLSALAARGAHNKRSRLAPRSPALERAVDRIAAELLMPERLVVPLLKEHCWLERESSSRSLVNKRKVVLAVGKALGVSEWTLVLRLQELTEILAVRFEFELSKPGFFGPADRAFNRMRVSSSEGLRIESHPYPSQSDLEGNDGWDFPVRARAAWGERTIHCQGWRRPSRDGQPSISWVLGWTWNICPIPDWDDSDG